MNRWLLLFVFGLWAANALADGINNSGNVGNSGTGAHEGILGTGTVVAFVPPICSNSLDFSKGCNSQYLLLKFP